MSKKRHPLVVKLKSGEYTGADIMQAWLLIETADAAIERLKESLEISENSYDILAEQYENALHCLKAMVRVLWKDNALFLAKTLEQHGLDDVVD